MGRSELSDLNTDPAPGHDPVPGLDPTTNEDDDDRGYVASLDLGTTTMRCLIYNKQAQVLGRAQEKVRQSITTVQYREFKILYVNFT